jgi:hypothetical protein
MAAAGGLPMPSIVPPGGAPPVDMAPQLPFGADRGTITGWLLDATLTKTPGTDSRGLEPGFNWLVGNIPAVANPVYAAAMRTMADTIINSDMLVKYLT